MGGPDGDGHDPDVETAVEGGDEVYSGGVDEGDVVPSVESTLLQQQACDLLSLQRSSQ